MYIITTEKTRDTLATEPYVSKYRVEKLKNNFENDGVELLDGIKKMWPTLQMFDYLFIVATLAVVLPDVYTLVTAPHSSLLTTAIKVLTAGAIGFGCAFVVVSMYGKKLYLNTVMRIRQSEHVLGRSFKKIEDLGKLRLGLAVLVLFGALAMCMMVVSMTMSFALSVNIATLAFKYWFVALPLLLRYEHSNAVSDDNKTYIVIKG